jgi:hypothetical protein
MSLPRLAYDPREGRDAKSSPALEWIPALGCWCVFETGTITAILKSADFVAAEFRRDCAGPSILSDVA